jgi:hypothetical protein
MRWPPKKVFVYGERVSNEDFLRVIREVCGRRGNKPEYFNHDSEFILVLGAAALAKRGKYLHYGTPHRLQ